MTIQLDPHQERVPREAIQQGRFRSIYEALDQALRFQAMPTDSEPLPSASFPLTPAQAAVRIVELRNGQFLPEGTTIRALIDEGRA